VWSKFGHVAGGRAASTIHDGPGLALPGATNPDALQDEFLPNDVIGVGTLRQQATGPEATVTRRESTGCERLS
jgi:hypothetical protein